MHSLLENYLVEVAVQLAPLPSARRNDELQELREHLLNAAATNREQGLSENEAARRTLEQFGSPEELGKRIAATWRRGEALKRRSLWGMIVFTVVSSVALTMLENLLIASYVNAHGIQNSMISPFRWVAGVCFFPVKALVAGMGGLIFARRAVIGTAIGIMLFRLLYWSGLLYVVRAAHGHISFNLPQMVFGELLTACVTLLAAWMGSRWRGRHTRLAHG